MLDGQERIAGSTNTLFLSDGSEHDLGEKSLFEVYQLCKYIREEYGGDTVYRVHHLLKRYYLSKIEKLYCFFKDDKGYFYNYIEEEDVGVLASLDLRNTRLFYWNSFELTTFADRHPGQVNHLWTRLDNEINRTLNSIYRLIL